MENIQKEELVALRQTNIGRLFQRAARAYSERALTKLHVRGHEGITLFHTALIANLDLEGTRISTLAHRAGMSKQAMGQLVTDLSTRDYIEKKPDPEDKRASLIFFTDLGWQLLQDAFLVKKEIEAEYAAVLGESEMAQLRDYLEQLLADSVNRVHGE